jgi:hypothetical protein
MYSPDSISQKHRRVSAASLAGGKNKSTKHSARTQSLENGLLLTNRSFKIFS